MKLFIATIFFVSVSASAKLIPKVIYGVDDRMDVYQSSDSLMRELSRSTSAMIGRNSLNFDGIEYTLTGKTLEGRGMCRSERFSSQLAVANCSGFLIAPDVLVTAGHCVTGQSDCDNYYWVFDFANTTGEVDTFKFNNDQVFSCSQILKRAKDRSTMDDFAVIKLNRPVPNRTPLQIRTSGTISDSAVVAVLGHPTGLPLKITSNAIVKENSDPVFFKINADTYGGNSGSAVVDMATGLVEGILVRGDTDYTYDYEASCSVSVIRPENGGRGEDATRITNINLP